MFLLSCTNASSSLYGDPPRRLSAQTQQNHGFSQQVLRENLHVRVNIHDLLVDTVCAKASRQRVSLRSFLSLCLRLGPCKGLSCAAHRSLPPSLMRCRSAGTPFFPALPVPHEMGSMPSNSASHRTGEETQLLLHFYVVQLAQLKLPRVSRLFPHHCLFFCEPQALLAEPSVPFRSPLAQTDPELLRAPCCRSASPASPSGLGP